MEEVVLSEIHISADSQSSIESTNANGYQVCSTKFHFFPESDSQTKYDEDGDLIVVRRADTDRNCLIIGHSLATKIIDVGLQIWTGCLLLCDFALASPQVFENKTVLELGAGVGMSSIVLAQIAKQVIATDFGDDILELCSSNLTQNEQLYKGHSVLVRELDWTSSEFKKGGRYGWTDEDIASLEQVELIVAADVIYDVDLTEALFKVLEKFMKISKPTVFIALEKRLNFSLEDLDVACKSYSHFRECLEQLKEKANAAKMQLTVLQMSTNFYQSFPQYERTKYLELWSIFSRC